MKILFDKECRKELGKSLRGAHCSVYIMSAFLKKHALEWFYNQIKNNHDIQVTIVARWKLQDLLTTASDLSAYEFARDHGWKFVVNSNMHYKIYLIDNEILFLGSSNLTQKGLHLDIDGNDEANVKITPTPTDIFRLKNYVKRCCLINDELYQEMREFVEQQDQVEKKPAIKWPKKVQQQLLLNAHDIRLDDLLFNSPSSLKDTQRDDREHDFLLLGLTPDNDLGDLDLLTNNFLQLPMWQWLIHTVSESEHEYVKFGEISEKLHNILSRNETKRIYRKDVAVYLSNLFEWIKYLNLSGITVRKINKTEMLSVW